MHRKKNLLRLILLVGDILLMYGALLLTLAVRYSDFSLWLSPQIRVFLFHFSFIFLFWLFLLLLLGFYEIPFLKKVFNFFYDLVLFLILAGSIGISYFYLQPQLAITPKTILLIDILIFGFFLFSWRYLISYFLKFQKFIEKIAIVGFRPELNELLTNFISQNGYKIITFFDLNPQKELDSFSNLVKFGVTSNVSRLKEIIEKEGINSIIFASDPHKNREMVQRIFTGLSLKLNYISFDSFYEDLTKKIPIEAIDEVWFLENLLQSEKRLEEVIKRGFDIIFSLLGLLITAVLLPFIALAIKIDSSGSIFYSQNRVGKDGKIFLLYKFRTMRADAEENGPLWATSNDSRITRVGRVIRKLYLDEFPQFYNIFKGDLCFVGPRPERPEFVSQLKKEILYYDIRHIVKPGLTGWAQISYRYSASVGEAKEKLKYDIYYIKNRSFFLDLGIILKTIRIIF